MSGLTRRQFFAAAAGVAATAAGTTADAAAQSGWIRQGECSNCGFCCAFEGPLAVRTDVSKVTSGSDASARRFLEYRGFEVRPGGAASKLAVVWSPCAKHEKGVTLAGKPLAPHTAPACSPLAPGGRCTIYAERPTVCRDFPQAPGAIEATPCSYWFEKVVDGRVIRRGGLGSPYPVTQSPAQLLTVPERRTR
jgi:Fe-S-cluster containining protein